jgi:glyoxylase-like metal-dependent hydrolase (beta-lactamase superfamily II)
VCTHDDDAEGEKRSVLVINDTGVGTNTSCHTRIVEKWNIASFVEQNLNPAGELPYLVLLSHCHYDHILGLNSLLYSEHDVLDAGAEARELQSRATVISSSHAQSFVTPYEVLMEHSLCASERIPAPMYTTSIWAGDNEKIVYDHPAGGQMRLPVITLHTPGHTPDSLSWYDMEERALYVGDSFYTQESTDTRNAPWGPENPAAILFPNEGDLFDWWRSIDKLAAFVEGKNIEGERPITLSAGHVTTSVDAATCLKDVKKFMAKVLRDEAHFEEQPAKRGMRFGHWTEKKMENMVTGSFSLGAPLRVIREGKEKIPREEWST